MKKALFLLMSTSVLAGSVFAQTAAPAVHDAMTKANAVTATVKSTTADVKAAATNVKATANAAVAAPVKVAAPAVPATTTAPATTAPAVQATGAGAGKVWVNGKVYHCEGTKFFGKTKHGAYMTEAEAKAKGAHGVKGQSCK